MALEGNAIIITSISYPTSNVKRHRFVGGSSGGSEGSAQPAPQQLPVLGRAVLWCVGTTACTTTGSHGEDDDRPKMCCQNSITVHHYSTLHYGTLHCTAPL